MANLLKIRELCKEKKITIREMANRVGLSEGALQALIKNGSTRTETLEKIAKELDVSAGIFFSEDSTIGNIGHTTNGNYNQIGSIEINSCPIKLEKALLKIEYLEQTLKDKEEIIELLKSKK